MILGVARPIASETFVFGMFGELKCLIFGTFFSLTL